MSILRLIKTRRSIRRFKKEKVSLSILKNILEAGRWAPSGLNNQPWRFKVLEDLKKDSLAVFTEYSSIIKGADKIILVFLDKSTSYHREKDLMAIGASMQNMLLYIHWRGLGACWLGEILNKKKEIQKCLKISSNLELVGIIALGKPWHLPKKVGRKKLKDLILKIG